MKRIFSLVAFCVLLISSVAASAQTRTNYFVKNSTNRHFQNPALAPEIGYVGIPMLSNVNVGLEGNMSASMFLYPLQNGQLGTFLHSSVGTAEFMKKVSNMNFSSVDFKLNILEAGWRTKRDAYWTVGMGLRMESDVSVPKPFFSFMKEGMTNIEENQYDIKNMSVRTRAYAETYVGYSREVFDGLRVGGKMRVLVSAGDACMNVRSMNIQMNGNYYAAVTNAEGFAAVKGLQVVTDESGKVKSYAYKGAEAGVAGWGLGFDIGASYSFDSSSPVSGLTLYLSATDLGFITNSASSVTDLRTDPEKVVYFEGAKNITDKNTNVGKVFQKFSDDLVAMVTPYASAAKSSSTTSLSSRIYVGADYSFLNDQMKAGILYYCRVGRYNTEHELMLSWNYSPVDWFNVALSYSFLNTRSSIGTLLSFTPRNGLNFFIGSDYIPFAYTAHGAPLYSSSVNCSFGISVPIQGNQF